MNKMTKKKSKPSPLSKVTLETKVLNQMKGSYLDSKIASNGTEAVIEKNETKHKNIIDTNPCFYKNQGHIASLKTLL